MMPTGEYYIGDLCYVLHDEWDEVCSLTINGNDCLEGEFTLKSGVRFAMYGTKYGDGMYCGIGVDSGTIGCVLLSAIDQTNKKNNISLGRIVYFKKEFETGSTEDCLISIGNYEIVTDDDFDN